MLFPLPDHDGAATQEALRTLDAFPEGLELWPRLIWWQCL